jgi:hypothetical protein
VKRLKELEPEFTEMKQENQKRRKAVALPKHRRASA